MRKIPFGDTWSIRRMWKIPLGPHGRYISLFSGFAPFPTLLLFNCSVYYLPSLVPFHKQYLVHPTSTWQKCWNVIFMPFSFIQTRVTCHNIMFIMFIHCVDTFLRHCRYAGLEIQDSIQDICCGAHLNYWQLPWSCWCPACFLVLICKSSCIFN
jgi:hypothetical protein